MHKDRLSIPVERRRSWKALAGLLAFSAFLVCLIAPLCLYAFAFGLGLEQAVPKQHGIWLVVFGGAIGAWVSLLVFRAVATRVGGVSEAEADAQWNGR